MEFGRVVYAPENGYNFPYPRHLRVKGRRGAQTTETEDGGQKHRPHTEDAEQEIIGNS